MKYQYYIGIDGGSHTGLAIWDGIHKEFVDIETSTFWEALERIRNFFPNNTLIVIEDPNQIKPTFPRNGALSPGKRDRISQNVGSVKRETELLAQGLERLGYNVRRVRPGPRAITYRKGKPDARTFKRITKYPGRTSQHGRDAALLVYGL